MDYEWPLNNLTKDEIDFYNSKDEVSKERIIKYLKDGLSFSDSVITEGSESLISYYNWIKDTAKLEDKQKIEDWNNKHNTSYAGENLTEYEKGLFDKLPNIGKWQVSNYSRFWRALEEADECLCEFIYHELNYLAKVK